MNIESKNDNIVWWCFNVFRCNTHGHITQRKKRPYNTKEEKQRNSWFLPFLWLTSNDKILTPAKSWKVIDIVIARKSTKNILERNIDKKSIGKLKKYLRRFKQLNRRQERGKQKGKHAEG